ncbi:MAG: hypothetical protein NVS1B10_03160 [Candidatus Saccharimonadales bacterium]
MAQVLATARGATRMQNEIYDQLQSGEISLDSVLNPGRELYDVDLDRLAISVMPSGFRSLDRDFMLLKEQEGELIIVGGRPSMGKSALMFQLALNVSRDLPVHVFSLEMSQESIVRRLISQMINRPVTAIQMGLVERELLEEAKEELRKYKYVIDDCSGLSALEVADRARTRAKGFGTRLIIVDYLQLLKTEKGHSKDSEIGEITKTLKSLAKELRCPIVVGSQLNRQCEIRGSSSGDYRPLLSDLRESGNIEQDADIILAVHRQARYMTAQQIREDRSKLTEAQVIVLKNRNGSVGETTMEFFAAQARFHDSGAGSSDI